MRVQIRIGDSLIEEVGTYVTYAQAFEAALYTLQQLEERPVHDSTRQVEIYDGDELRFAAKVRNLNEL